MSPSSNPILMAVPGATQDRSPTMWSPDERPARLLELVPVGPNGQTALFYQVGSSRQAWKEIMFPTMEDILG